MEGIYITIGPKGHEVIVDEAMYSANRATIMDSLVSSIQHVYHKAKDLLSVDPNESPNSTTQDITGQIKLQTNLKGGIKFNQDGQVVFTDSNFKEAIKDIATYASSLVLTYHDNDAFFQILNMYEFKMLFLFIAADQEATDRLAKALFAFFDVAWRKPTKTPSKDLEMRESLIQLVQHMKIGKEFDLSKLILYNTEEKKEDVKGTIYPCGR